LPTCSFGFFPVSHIVAGSQAPALGASVDVLAFSAATQTPAWVPYVAVLAWKQVKEFITPFDSREDWVATDVGALGHNERLYFALVSGNLGASEGRAKQGGWRGRVN
jgi:hypothetical protein